ncbi:hypothetical protein LIN78_02715 [Leeia sp. TBRC 13508]|uniref:Yip1 domain-containing protein n=1 Tax=Leeia speluncae TaxID=2884804 RepID=A0ABS8D485_9NEIS|nr:hypothetical protein [Leeia speluncae]MCB6182463.1 hypothetical protein [Leeia speluncae]
MKNRRTDNLKRPESPGIIDRIFMAMFAPIVFNIAVLLILVVIYRESRIVGGMLVGHIQIFSKTAILMTVFFPAVVGFILGTNRFVKLLGHLCYTNFEEERDINITIICWLVLLSITYLISKTI